MHNQSSSERPVIFIIGPTASGKTSRAVDLARAVDGEIISADSRQVYREMDLGTGKDLGDYGDVPYHLIDIVPAGHKYNLYEYLRDFDRARADIENRGHNVIVCGGTGLYVESALKGLHLPEVPENTELRSKLKGHSLEQLSEMLSAMKTLHNVTDVDTAQRAIRAIEIETYYLDHPEAASLAKPSPMSNAVIIGVDIPREARRQRITHRLKQRLDEGMVDEIKALLQSGLTAEQLIYYGLEYKFITQYVIGQLSFEQMFTDLETAIHQFAKRQMTWFRGMERRGFHIEWLPWDMDRAEFVGKVNYLVEQYSANAQ